MMEEQARTSMNVHFKTREQKLPRIWILIGLEYLAQRFFGGAGVALGSLHHESPIGFFRQWFKQLAGYIQMVLNIRRYDFFRVMMRAFYAIAVDY